MPEHPPAENHAVLDINPDCPLTAIYVEDHTLHRVADGLGSLVLNVQEGLYRITLVAGGDRIQQPVHIRRGAMGERVHLQMTPGRPIAPLYRHGLPSADRTEITRASLQAEYAQMWSHHGYIQPVDPQGSGELFVFVRANTSMEDPLPEMSLTKAERSGDHDRVALRNPIRNTVAACEGYRAKVPPGAYELRWKPLGSPDHGSMEVTVTEGWQAQAFLQCSQQGRRTKVRAIATSVLNGRGFDPARPEYRWNEILHHMGSAPLSSDPAKTLAALATVERAMDGNVCQPELPLSIADQYMNMRQPSAAEDARARVPEAFTAHPKVASWQRMLDYHQQQLLHCLRHSLESLLDAELAYTKSVLTGLLE